MRSVVDAARGAFARGAWREACDAFSAAAEAGPLRAEDFERLAVAAYLVGEDDVCAHAWECAHRSALEAGDGATAARYAVLLSMCLFLKGQMATAGGWLARAERVLADAGPDCAASGYVLILRLLGALGTEPSLAADLAVRAAEVGMRAGDADLRALGVLGHGQALIAMGEVPEGVGRLDEVMVSVISGEVGPVVSASRPWLRSSTEPPRRRKGYGARHRRALAALRRRGRCCRWRAADGNRHRMEIGG